MTGPATYAEDRGAAEQARAELDAVEASVRTVDAAQRATLARLIRLWPTAAWLVAGAKTARSWLVAHTGMAPREARRLERIAHLCSTHPALAEAVVSGTFRLAWADRLARSVTPERAPFLEGSLHAFLGLATAKASNDEFDSALRYWTARVDEHLEPRTVPKHAVVLSRRLFGGGQAQVDLGSAAFETFASTIDSWTQDPDPEDAPYRRPLAERRADGLTDLCHFANTHDPEHDADGDPGTTLSREDEEDLADDTFDGTAGCDDLDIEQEHPELDQLERLRIRIRRAERRQRRRARRRIRRRSGVTTNVHIDLKTLSGKRAIDDFDGLVLRGDKWPMARAAADQLLCDSRLVATLFAGRTGVLDTNTAAEQFSLTQRRALAARDGGCVFPGCQTHPRHCDIHHLQHREHGGPTTLDNAATLCRFHHRLLHEHGWALTSGERGWVATDPHGTAWTSDGPVERRTTDQDAA